MAIRLAMVPEGTKSAASLPDTSAQRASRAFTLGSSPKTSSPKGAAIMAARIASVGIVTVSERRSTIWSMDSPGFAVDNSACANTWGRRDR